jgi:hypothetical protein
LGCLPSFIALVSHRGFIPRPVHVSPSGPRYFGAAFLRIVVLPLSPPLADPRLSTAPPVSRSSSLFRSSARLLRRVAISSRSLHRASFDRVVSEDLFGCTICLPEKNDQKNLNVLTLTVLLSKINGSRREASKWLMATASCKGLGGFCAAHRRLHQRETSNCCKKQDIAFRYSTQACRFRSPEPIGSQIRAGVDWLEGSLSSNLKRIPESSVPAPSLPPIPYG